MYHQLHDPAFLAVASGGTPALDLFFSATKALDSRITFSRGSSGTFINSSGLVESATTNTPRFTHDPSTLESLGLLIEEARTNSITRSVVSGAVAGSPGTAPTGWSVTLGTSNGVTRSISATGTDSQTGLAYFDLTLSGTFTLAENINATPAPGVTTIAASVGQAWSASMWWAVVAGTLPAPFTANISGVRMRFGSPALLIQTGSSDTPNTDFGVRQRNENRVAPASTTVVGADFLWSFGAGQAINCTLRFAAPQLELGAFATSYIPTTGASATRAADVATMTGTNFSSWFNSTGGTLVAEGILGATSGSRRMFTFGGSTLGVGTRVNGSTSSIIWRNPTNYDASTGTVSAGAIKQAFSYAPSLLSGVVNGGTIATNTPPSSLPATYANVGSSETGFDYWNGTISRIRYFRRRLPNANLQTLTT